MQSLDVLVEQIHHEVETNDPALVKLLQMCSRLLTPKQLAYLKYRVQETFGNGDITATPSFFIN